MSKKSFTDELYQYCDDVLTDKVIACQKYKWACLRFIRDLEKGDSWRWAFDEKRALRYMDWMQLFKHSKGPLAGQQKISVDYEKFVYGNIYGWIDSETELRRFRRSYEQLARKNAKSQDKGIQSLYEISAFGEAMAEAYVAATKKEQTRHVWGEASWLYKNSIDGVLADKFVTKFDQELQQVVIRHKKSGSFFSRLSKDDKKTGDGTNPHFVVLDEYHLHETTEYYDLATSGMKTRTQPLLSIITTAGFELNNPCYRVEYDYVSKILDPNNPIENDRYFVAICEADVDENGTPVDDLHSDEIRLKSNPIIGNAAVGIESIDIDIQEALDKPEKKRDLLTKTFNIWVNQRDAGYMNMEKWAACGATKDNPFPDVKGKTVFGGVDLSSTLDLTSVFFDIPLEGGTYAVLSHSFIPEETLELKRKTDKVPYDLWISQRWITATPGAEVDYHYVLEYIVKQYEEYGWPKGEICFDRALASWLIHELQARDFTPVDIGQWYNMLSEPTKDFRAKVYNKKVIHNNNPVLTWAISNAILRTGPSGNVMLDKGKAAQRIDPIASGINAHTRAMVNEDTRSVYEERGVLSI
jgi:phage terminase large subunit-like protein